MESRKLKIAEGKELAMSKISKFILEPIPLDCEKTMFLDSSRILGIIFYGSYQTGNFNSKSDIDIHIIMEDSFEKLYRGAKTIDGKKIEYFIKPIRDLYFSADIDFQMQNNALLPIVGLGDIICDTNGIIKKLQNYVLAKYSQPLPPLEVNQARELAVIIDNFVQSLNNLYLMSDIYFNQGYAILIEKMRKFYSRLSGCPDVPTIKVNRLYTDEEYRISFCKSSVPDETFREMFLKATTVDLTNEEKMSIVKEMYDYTTRDLGIDPNDYCIEILSRNNPFNNVHN